MIGASSSSGGDGPSGHPSNTWDQSDGPAPPPRPRFARVERYEIRGLLGEGGMGRVWLAYDRELEREVAYKELDVPNARPSAIARFLQEAQLTARLEHPGIVTVHDAGAREDGGLFYVMRVIRGRSLADVLRDTAKPQDRIALLDELIDACQAVAFAHSQGILHRDLKPDNIMIGEFGETIVVDWGLAKLFEQGPQPDVTSSSPLGAIVGTPHYMSPEQAMGRPVDARTDVWSFGVMLYELLAGCRPIVGDDALSVVAAVARGAVRPLSETAPDAPPDLAAVVRRALATAPADRYPDAGALVADLRAWRTGLKVSAYAYTPLEDLRRFVGRYRVPLAGLGVGLGIAALATAVGWFRTARERDRAVEAEVAARAAEEEAEVARADVTRMLQRTWVDRAQAAGARGDPIGALGWASAALELGEDLEARGVVARFWDRLQHTWTAVPGALPAACVDLKFAAGGWTCAGANGVWSRDGDRTVQLDARPAAWTSRAQRSVPPGGATLAIAGPGWGRVLDARGRAILELTDPEIRTPVIGDGLVYWGAVRGVTATDLATGEPRWTVPTSSLVGGLAADEDDALLWQANGAVARLSGVDGRHLTTWGRAPAGMRDASFSPDRQTVVFTNLAGGVGLLRSDGGLVTLRDRGPDSRVGWSSDGRFAWAHDEERISVWTAAGERTLEVPAPRAHYTVGMSDDGRVQVALGEDLFQLGTRQPTPAVLTNVGSGVGVCAAPDATTLWCSTGASELLKYEVDLGTTTRADDGTAWPFRHLCPVPGADVVGLSAGRIHRFGSGAIGLAYPEKTIAGGEFACASDGGWAAGFADQLWFGRDIAYASHAVSEPTLRLVWWNDCWLRAFERPDGTLAWERWSTDGQSLREPFRLDAAPGFLDARVSPGGTRLAVRVGPDQVVVVDRSGAEMGRLQLDDTFHDFGFVDEALIAAVGAQVVAIFDPRDGRQLATLAGHAARVSWYGAPAGDRARFVTTDHAGNVIRWNLSSLELAPKDLAARVIARTGYRHGDGRLEMVPPR